MIVNAAGSARRKLGDSRCRTDSIDRREAEMWGINRAKMAFGYSRGRTLQKQSHDARGKLKVSKGIQYTHIDLCLLIRSCPRGREIGDQCWTLDRRGMLW